jgi:hypothetical protein
MSAMVARPVPPTVIGEQANVYALFAFGSKAYAPLYYTKAALVYQETQQRCGFRAHL